MSCDEIEELLSDLLDDELPAGTRAGVEAHLAACGRCAASYRALARTVRFVRANAGARLAPHTPGGVYADFTRAIADREYGREPVATFLEGIGGLTPRPPDDAAQVSQHEEG